MSFLALRLASRSLRRTPAFSISAILTLVIGIGAVVSIFAVINSVLLRPLSFGNPERLVGAWHALPGVSIDKGQQTAGTYFTYQRHAKTIENIGLAQEGSVNVAAPGGDGEPQRVPSALVTNTLVPTLKVSPLLGRNFTEAEDLPNGPRVVLISEQMWRNRFGGDRGVIGRMLEVNGVSREIVGVMPASLRYPTAETRLWLPMQLDPNATFGGGFNYNGIARLAPGATLEQARAEFAAVLPRMVEIYPELVPGVTTQMLLDQAKPSPILIPLRKDLTASISRTLWLVGAAAGLVLLVACANVANLILVRADSRYRELAVREALGAGRARVLSYFVAEAAVIAGVSGLSGIMVAAVVVRTLSVMGPANIPRLAELRLDIPAIGFAVIVTLVVAAIITLLPSMRVGRMPLSSALREGGRSGTVGKAQHRLRGAMVAMQIALSLVALAGSGLLIRTFQRLNAVHPGFESRNVATFWLSLPRARYANDSGLVTFWSTLTTRVAALPGVQSVGLTTRLPLNLTGMNQNPFYAEDDPTAAQKIPPLQIYANTDAGYFKTLGIPVLAGRTFDDVSRQRGDEVVISQRTAEHFWKDPTGQAAIGKRFRMLPTGPWNTVVGVVGSVRDTALAAMPTQSVYMPISIVRDSITAQSQRTLALVVKTAGDPVTIRQPVEGLIRELDPTLPTFDVQPMAVLVRESIAQLSFMIIMLGAAAVVTLLLGAIGLYGVMAYVVTLRMRELGVRVALGASPRSVIQMMIRQGLVLTVAGIAAGLVLFAVVARFFRSFLYGVAPGDPVTLSVASAFLVGIAMLASWLPARRASLVDPARVLRSD